MTGLRSSWPRTRPEPADPAAEATALGAMRRRVWQQQGVVMLVPEEIDDEWTRRAVEAEAVRLYGHRTGGVER